MFLCDYKSALKDTNMPPRSLPMANDESLKVARNHQNYRHNSQRPNVRCKRCRIRLACDPRIIRDHLLECIDANLRKGHEVSLAASVPTTDASASLVVVSALSLGAKKLVAFFILLLFFICIIFLL